MKLTKKKLEELSSAAFYKFGYNRQFNISSLSKITGVFEAVYAATEDQWQAEQAMQKVMDELEKLL